MSANVYQSQTSQFPAMQAPAPAVTYSSPYTYQSMGGAPVPMEPIAGPGPMPVVQGAAQAVSYQTQAAPQITYGAPQVVSQGQPQYVQAQPQEASQSYTYVQPQEAAAPQPSVTYMQAQPQEAVAGQQVMYMQAPTVMQAAPQAYSVQQYAQLPSAPSMVAYPSPIAGTAYFPMSVQQVMDNHFAGFGSKEVEKLMLDYDETSILRVYNNADGQLMEYRGTAQIREFFAGFFRGLPEVEEPEMPVKVIEEDPKQAYLVWKSSAKALASGGGASWATDTLILGADFKIKRQNLTWEKKASSIAVAAGAVAAGAAAAAAPASGVSSAKASSKKEKGSKKKLSSKKKKSGFC